MALQNYRDLSVAGNDFNAGFQFEFSCHCCGRRWKSPFKPYRMGQVTGLLQRFLYLLPNLGTAGRTSANFADFGTRGARESALNEAMVQAERVFSDCEECRMTVCEDCIDASTHLCKSCSKDRVDARRNEERQQAQEESERAALTCPNCRSPHGGGRFCAECGFDMASTHKSCPSCGALVGRTARFCTDCGHSF